MTQALKSIDAHAAAKLQKEGAMVVDVREASEFAGTRVPGSQNVALSRLAVTELPLEPGQAVVFLCASGNRTNVHASRLAEKAGAAKAYVMEGGLSGWRRAGLPVESGDGKKAGDGGAGSGFLSRLFAR